MRGGMVLPDRGAARVVDLEQQRITDPDRALLDLDGMHEQVAGFLLRVDNGCVRSVAPHLASVADLTARLAMERRLVHYDGTALAFLELGTFFFTLPHP